MWPDMKDQAVDWWRGEKWLQNGGQLRKSEGGLLWTSQTICSFIESDQDLWFYSAHVFPCGQIIDKNAESYTKIYNLLLKYYL